MPQKVESSATSLADALERMTDKDRAFSFDVTLELTTPSLRVGAVRIHGKIEAVAPRKK